MPSSSDIDEKAIEDVKPAIVVAKETSKADHEEEEDVPENNDLVIRDGFPALRLPGGKRPNIDGVEPLPRHKIWASDRALRFAPNHMDALIADCEAVFTARTREDDQAYSAGTTYFLPCQMQPRCALEALVHSIFNKHTAALDSTTFLPEQSGAEWWTLVLADDDDKAAAATANDPPKNNDDDSASTEEEGDEVGLHFDADYGLEAQAPNLLLHPRLASVTYLTDHGSPTVVLDVPSPPPNDTEKKSLGGSILTGWLSAPKVGKHMVFDGRLLHGAPSTFFPGQTAAAAPAAASTTSAVAEQQQPPLKKVKLNQQPPAPPPRKRITLLVNLWLNHCPLDAEPLDDEVVEQLKTPWTKSTAENTDDSFVPPFFWNDNNFDLDATTECQTVSLTASETDPAGSEEVVICGRLVTVSYGASMQDFHKASSAASAAGLVKLELASNVISLEVGDEVPDEEE